MEQLNHRKRALTTAFVLIALIVTLAVLWFVVFTPTSRLLGGG